MASRRSKKRDGGLKTAEQFVGLLDLENSKKFLDVVFVSIDLEVHRDERAMPGVPFVKEFGVATLDTRHLKHGSPPPTQKVISTQQFSTSHASVDFLDCDVTDFGECVFTETFRVSQEELPATVMRSLRIHDDDSSNAEAFRNIVLVGYSLKCDLGILQRLGIDIYQTAPVLALLDTHIIAQKTLGPDSSSLNGATPLTSFTLEALLRKLGCPFERSDFHNAGNDATYTLHALLMLVIKSSENRGALFSLEKENLENLRAVMRVEMHEYPRWKPRRRPVGFYVSEVLGNDQVGRADQ